MSSKVCTKVYTSDPEVMKKSKRGKKRKSDRLQRRLGFIFVPCYHLYIYHYSVFDVFSKRCSDIFNSAYFFFLFVSNLSIPRLSQLPKDSDSSKASCRMGREKDPEIRLKNWRGSPRRPASTSVGSAPPLLYFFSSPGQVQSNRHCNSFCTENTLSPNTKRWEETRLEEPRKSR